jgi:hypothetical protein
MARATRKASGRAMKASLLVVRWCVIAAPSLATGTCSAELKRQRRLATAAPVNDAEPLEAAAVSKPRGWQRETRPLLQLRPSGQNR